MYNNIAIIGASGAIGQALSSELLKLYPNAIVNCCSRQYKSSVDGNCRFHHIDYYDETSLESTSNACTEIQPLDLVIIATGLLHDDQSGVFPEKSLRDLSFESFESIFKINATVPAMIAKYFVPKMSKDRRSIFAALSARVGSTSDNQLGGWYAYRASKAALNMVIKNIAIEIKRSHKESIVIGLHPGTVESALSKPFQNNVPKEKLFSPEKSAKHLIDVVNDLDLHQTGKCFAWDGQEIMP